MNSNAETASFASRIKREGRAFLDAIKNTSEAGYLVLLTSYVIIFLALKISWTSEISDPVENIRYGILSLVMWGSTIYLFFVITKWRNLWKNTPALIIIGGALVAITAYFSAKMSTNAYGVVMDVFFCLMAYGKDYKKILKCIMWATVAMLIIAAVGSFTGLTEDLQKPWKGGIFVGHSYGINYPNTWGYLVFLALMTGWYSYLKGKHILTFVIFWLVAAFMYIVIQCRTISYMTIVFPVFALIVVWLEKRPAKDKKGIGFWGWLWTIAPILALAFVLIVSVNFEWVQANVPDDYSISSVKYRFVHNGLYLKAFGFPLFGNAYRSNVHSYINVNGKFIEPGILDCSYISYAIMRGAVWMGYTILWLCLANYKAIRKRDYAINFLSAILLIFAMIERPGLEMWYNFVMIYPLAAVNYIGRRKEPETVDAVPVTDAVEPHQEATLPDGRESISTDVSDEIQTPETGDR